MTFEPVLSVKDLSVYLDKHCLVQNVSFTINPHECVGIVGESGSGKTLTAQAIGGLSSLVSKGLVIFNNKNLLSLHEKDLKKELQQIGFVFQNPQGSLNPLMKVGLQILETSAFLKKEDVLNLLKYVGMEDPLRSYQSYPHELSGGMCQRIMIAIAIAKNPSLIIADEPTTALDVNTQTQILLLFKNLLKEKKTSLLLITHDFDVIENICDKIIVMYAGKIIETGKKEDVIKSPKHPYTEALLKARPSFGMKKSDFLKSIPGSPPSLLNKSPICSFYPRCEKKIEACRIGQPELISVRMGQVACFRGEKKHE